MLDKRSEYTCMLTWELSFLLFAMRSCEYMQVSGPRKTKLLTFGIIKFLKGQRALPHRDPLLHRAECVSITFKFQKRDTRNDVITQFRSSDPLLCPVKIWAKIIGRILSYQPRRTQPL